LFTPTAPSANYLNGQFDSIDITQSSGEYQLFIGGKPLPSKPLSTLNNRAGILTSLRQATTSLGVDFTTIYDKANNGSISDVEFNRPAANAANSSSLALPAKFYLGIHTELLHNNSIIYSGVSSQGSAIVLKVNSPTATALNVNALLILCYDALIEVDIVNQQINVLQ
jgi:hypothetical protein